jgi:hypothetical protein
VIHAGDFRGVCFYEGNDWAVCREIYFIRGVQGLVCSLLNWKLKCQCLLNDAFIMLITHYLRLTIMLCRIGEGPLFLSSRFARSKSLGHFNFLHFPLHKFLVTFLWSAFHACNAVFTTLLALLSVIHSMYSPIIFVYVYICMYYVCSPAGAREYLFSHCVHTDSEVHAGS